MPESCAHGDRLFPMTQAILADHTRRTTLCRQHFTASPNTLPITPLAPDPVQPEGKGLHLEVASNIGL